MRMSEGSESPLDQPVGEGSSASRTLNRSEEGSRRCSGHDIRILDTEHTPAPHRPLPPCPPCSGRNLLLSCSWFTINPHTRHTCSLRGTQTTAPTFTQWSPYEARKGTSTRETLRESEPGGWGFTEGTVTGDVSREGDSHPHLRSSKNWRMAPEAERDGARGRKTVRGRGRQRVPPVGWGKGRTVPGEGATRPEARPRSPRLQR